MKSDYVSTIVKWTTMQKNGISSQRKGYSLKLIKQQQQPNEKYNKLNTLST